MQAYEYPSAPGRIFYAPQLRAIAAPGRSANIVSLGFALAGWKRDAPPIACGAAISDSLAREMNGEVYGDWAFSIDGNAPTSPDATATIVFVDDSGTMATMTVAGSIVPGALPTTYSNGGHTGGACFHGFGS